MKFTSQFFSSTDESLKDESCLLLLWDGSLVTVNTLCSYNTICGEASAHLCGEDLSLCLCLCLCLSKYFWKAVEMDEKYNEFSVQWFACSFSTFGSSCYLFRCSEVNELCVLSDVRFICRLRFLHYLFDDFRLKSEQFRGQLVLTISFYSTFF